MKTLILKSGHDSWDDYYENIDYVFLIPDNAILNESIIDNERIIFDGLFKKKLNNWRKANHSGDGRKGSVSVAKFKKLMPKHMWSFKDYLIKKYSLVEIEFIDYLTN